MMWEGFRLQAPGVRSGTLLLAIVALAVGCSRSNKDFTPTALKAEEALRAGLDAWKADLQPGPVAGTQPPVQVVDNNRKPGQRLREYKILGEKQVPSGRTFTVVLQLDEPVEEVRTYYHVVGIDPLWVFRKEDYELLSHWDHYMPEQEKSEQEEEAKKEASAADVKTKAQPASESSASES